MLCGFVRAAGRAQFQDFKVKRMFQTAGERKNVRRLRETSEAKLLRSRQSREYKNQSLQLGKRAFQPARLLFMHAILLTRILTTEQ